MPTLRQRFAGFLLGSERTQSTNAVRELIREALLPTPAGLENQLSEVDSQLVDLILRQRGYQFVGAGGMQADLFSETERLATVIESRRMNHYDVMVHRAIQMWTDFGFGQKPQVIPQDATLAKIFKACWEAPANNYIFSAREIHNLSDALTVDGEYLMLVYASTLDGTCTIRTLATDRLGEIVFEPDDPAVPVYYVQNTNTGAVYYPDWRATAEQLDGVSIPREAKTINQLMAEKGRTTVCKAMHVAIDKHAGRGWPQLYRALAWADAYKTFIENRATIAAAVAAYVEEIKVKGGSRSVDAVQARLESALSRMGGNMYDTNPAPAAGSTRIINDAIETKRLPLTTGAGDAQTDGLTIAAQFANGAGVPLHYLGRADAMQNRAVAKESSRPWYEQIQRYQDLWISVFQDLVKIVGQFAEDYSGATIAVYTTEVVLDSPFDTDVLEAVSAMGAVTASVQAQTLPKADGVRATQKLTELMLAAFGVRDPAAVLRPVAGEKSNQAIAPLNMAERLDELADLRQALTYGGGERRLVSSSIIDVYLPSVSVIHEASAQDPMITINVAPTPVTLQVNPAPVTIENTVNVEPTPISVENTVNVEPTPVSIDNVVNVSKPNAALLLARDSRGQIIGGEIRQET